MGEGLISLMDGGEGIGAYIITTCDCYKKRRNPAKFQSNFEISNPILLE